MKKRIAIFFSLAALAAAFTACEKKKGPEVPLPGKNRTVIEYMVADNNLYSYAEGDINEMEAAWSEGYDGRLVVFLYPPAAASGYASGGADYDERPRLLLISRDDDQTTISSRVLKTYDRESDPTDPVVMGRVVEDAMKLAPAEGYALVFWSHGSGWLPKGAGQPLKSALPPADDPLWAGSKLAGMASSGGAAVSDEGTTAYSFGQSGSHGNNEMEIDELARALPAGIVFDFILFDACHMASIELAWELKDHTDYLIASAAETLADGFPYARMMEAMFAPRADAEAIGREFYEYYDARSGAYRSATVGVVRSDKLPSLAGAVKALCDAGLPAAGISYAGQQYGRRSVKFHDTFYDLEDFVVRTWGEDDPLVASFRAALAGAVVYAAATPVLFNELRVDTHCGVSCYLPRSSTPVSLEAYRSRFGWSAASGMGTLVP